MKKPELISTLKRLGWISLFFVVLILIVSAVERRNAIPTSQVDITIKPLPDGNALINEKDILQTIGRSFGYDLADIQVGAIDVERLERVLKEDPFILNADVYIDAKSGVNIKVEQREPVLRIMDNNGLNYYLDEKGIKLPLSKHFTARVLVATGNLPPHFPEFLGTEEQLQNNLLKDVFQLSQLIQADLFFEPLIEQIYVSNRGEFTLIPKVGKQKIIFGKFQNATKKLNRLKIFYEEGMPYKGWRKYKTINVKYDGQVVCEK